jgi:hypothetical protein
MGCYHFTAGGSVSLAASVFSDYCLRDYPCCPGHPARVASACAGGAGNQCLLVAESGRLGRFLIDPSSGPIWGLLPDPERNAVYLDICVYSGSQDRPTMSPRDSHSDFAR